MGQTPNAVHSSKSFRLLIAPVPDNERFLAPSVEVVLEVVRNNIGKQHPGLIPILCPGELATASIPLWSIGEMWMAFGGFDIMTPAINVENRFTLLLSWTSNCTLSHADVHKTNRLHGSLPKANQFHLVTLL